MKILHISESFEGGVASAVANYVDLTPEHEHFLLCNKRGGRLGGGILGKFSTVHDLTKGHFSAVKTVRSVVDKVKPDVIHCHSSIGGGYTRLAYFLRKRPALLVFSPHCYSFERLDLSWPARAVSYVLEWGAARWTDVVVACSVREERLARRLRRKMRVVYVPNLPSVASGSSLPFGRRKDRVVMVGRLSPQKDPEWFVDFVRLVGVEFVWVGDGEARYREILEQAGVRVVGWVESKEVAKTLRETKVYLHSARWEGFPITILDAHACGAAIVARKATYLEGVRGVEAGTVEAAVREVQKLLENSQKWQKNKAVWDKALADNTSLLAKKRLSQVYKLPIS